ncbi:MAG TPA: hypothetical protein VF633_01945 [Brevundimonas sp.]|jgi:hypothetical protein
MKILSLAAAATLALSSAASAQVVADQTPAAGTPVPWSQTTRTPAPAAAPAPAAQGAPVAAPLDLQIPEITGTAGDPTCGGRPALTQQAFCIQTTQAAMQTVADQYDAAFQKQGWLAAGGKDNLTVYVKRKDGGGCTGFQLMAFADETRQAAPGAPGYFAFATIPGDVCAARPETPAAAQ